MNTIPPVVAAAELLRRRDQPPLWVDPAVASTSPYGDELTYSQIADRIVHDVGRGGDKAIRRLAAAAGQTLPAALEVDAATLAASARLCPSEVVEAIGSAVVRIREFYEAEPGGSWQYECDGVTLGQLARPVERVGVYVPRR
ncbi:MAG: histidinol dehydrogenase [Actinobacteria bacterium]|nr:histidinol dehydrogenase [Actinomycetota bacterium]